jgi:hypothetical protein
MDPENFARLALLVFVALFLFNTLRDAKK